MTSPLGWFDPEPWQRLHTNPNYKPRHRNNDASAGERARIDAHRAVLTLAATAGNPDSDRLYRLLLASGALTPAGFEAAS